MVPVGRANPAGTLSAKAIAIGGTARPSSARNSPSSVMQVALSMILPSVARSRPPFIGLRHAASKAEAGAKNLYPAIHETVSVEACDRSAIALLFPRIAAIMIAALFPKARAVLRDQFDALDPFRAFPEIELGHDRTHQAAMLVRQRLALPGMRQQHIVVVEIRERKVCGV